MHRFPRRRALFVLTLAALAIAGAPEMSMAADPPADPVVLTVYSDYV